MSPEEMNKAEETEKLTYAQAVRELEEIVARMQGDNCDIDKLSTYTRRAIKLLRLCRERLTATDEEIKKCLEELS